MDHQRQVAFGQTPGYTILKCGPDEGTIVSNTKEIEKAVPTFGVPQGHDKYSVVRLQIGILNFFLLGDDKCAVVRVFEP